MTISCKINFPAHIASHHHACMQHGRMKLHNKSEQAIYIRESDISQPIILAYHPRPYYNTDLAIRLLVNPE
jgi:hypothetical protein